MVEADESDRSLLKLDPQIAVLTNAELDHHATYSSRLDLEETLRTFMARADTGAVVWDRPELRALCPPDAVPFSPQDLVVDEEGSRFAWRGIEVRLVVPGAHNAVNAAGALTACVLAGADPERAAAALADFSGARRRLERLGSTASGAAVYDDYAHHPTEVAAVIAAMRALAPRRLVAVFQPHLYSRTRALAREFGGALADADLVVVLPVYPARESAADFPGVDGHLVAAAAADAPPRTPVAWMPGFEEARRYLDGAAPGRGHLPGDGRRERRLAGPRPGHLKRSGGRPRNCCRGAFYPPSVMSDLPPGVTRQLPAGPPDHDPRRRPRRAVRAARHHRRARGAAGLGRGAGDRGRGSRLGVEPPGGGCRCRWTRTET